MHIIGGIHRKRKLKSPKTEATRPTSSLLRETLFNICQWEIGDASFLDLFAGAGAVGLEALSRGAKKATFVDHDRQSAKIIEENIQLLEETERAELLCQDVFQALSLFEKRGARFDIIFADPPYGKGLSDELLMFIERRSLLNQGGSLFLEDELPKNHQEPVLSKLTLKSQRKVGRASLRHYIYGSLEECNAKTQS